MTARGRDEVALTVPGYRGDEIELTVLSRDGATGDRPAIYHLHAGAGILGDRNLGVEVLADWVQSYDVVVVTVEYRLAPEFPDPYPVEDSYAGLVWTAEHAEELGVDPARILLEGTATAADWQRRWRSWPETAAGHRSSASSSCT